MIVTVEQESIPPRVRIETTAADVYRTIGTDTIRVRGIVAGGVIYDYELPQAVEAVYSDGLEASAPVQMPDVGMWLVHVGRPDLSVRVRLSRHDSWSSPANVSTLRIPGAATFAVTFRRSPDSGSLTLKIRSEREIADLRSVLSDGSVLFFSAPPRLGMGCPYLAIGDVDISRIGQFAQSQNRMFSLPYVEVSRPTFVASTTTTIGSLTGSIGSLVGAIADLGG